MDYIVHGVTKSQIQLSDFGKAYVCPSICSKGDTEVKGSLLDSAGGGEGGVI